jgi:DNA-binding NarL/FixJ family response regulator
MSLVTESPDPSTTVRAAGWAELGAGRWQEARTLFDEALAAGETAEGYEGLSWAAWWLDDAETVFDARERAYRLYRRSDDARSAARMAAWLASDQLDFRGAAAVAGGWLQRAHRLIDPLEPGPEHGWLAFFEGYVASMSGAPATAAELGARAAELGRRFDVPDLEMLGLALEGATLVGLAQVRAGMRCLDEATAMALAGEAEVPISGAWACCFLVSACTAVRDHERAYEWCDRIAEFAERYGSRYMLAFCRAEYGVVRMWRGEWREAEALFEAAIEDFTSSRPAMVGPPLVGLAELKRRQGRLDEATALLDRAGSSGRALLSRARLALDRGDARAAAELADRILRRAPAEPTLGSAPALDIRARARIARGELDEASADAAALRMLEEHVDTAAFRASTDLVAGMLEAARGHHESARALLEDAVDGFESSRAPFDAAQARIALATSLSALGQRDPAVREAQAALEQLTKLGASSEAERARRTLLAVSGDSKPGDERRRLTKREHEVLGLLTDGLTNRQIAERLVVSEHTVHRHVTSILRKLDLPSRTAAAAYALRSGLLEQPS